MGVIDSYQLFPSLVDQLEYLLDLSRVHGKGIRAPIHIHHFPESFRTPMSSREKPASFKRLFR